jgi:hypothetical protein
MSAISDTIKQGNPNVQRGSTYSSSWVVLKA